MTDLRTFIGHRVVLSDKGELFLGASRIKSGVIQGGGRMGLLLVLRDGHRKPEEYHPSFWKLV
jgi:hypothetical protein